MMLSGLAQSRPLLTELAVDMVSTSDSPSVSASRQPMPKSRMRTWPSGADHQVGRLEQAVEQALLVAQVESLRRLDGQLDRLLRGRACRPLWTILSSVSPSTSGQAR